jgi:crotonobetainyl-CoA:carnitine CoA-transferase CaiB-like acyl-CoA transferase
VTEGVAECACKKCDTRSAAHRGPLDGVRVLAVEQMQALPFATQLLAHLGADVVKVEHPVHGESGRGSRPQIADRDGRRSARPTCATTSASAASGST